MLRGYPLRNRLVLFLLMVISTLLVGSIGYVYIKGYIEGGKPTVIDALYWTVVTISTLGYSNNDVSLTSQIGKAFSIFMIVSGVFIIFIGIEIGIGPWFEAKMRKIVEKKSAPIPGTGHVIVAGLNELGEESIQELMRRRIPVVAVDPEQKRVKYMIDRGIPSIHGDPTRDDVLNKANIHGAKAIILTSEDTENAFIALTARHISPKIKIAASASETSSEKVLRNSGASVIATPEAISGEMLASKVLGEEESARKIDPFSYLYQISADKYGFSGKKLGSLHKYGIFPVGIRRKGEFIPFRKDEIIRKGDIINIIGTYDSLKKIKGGSV